MHLEIFRCIEPIVKLSDWRAVSIHNERTCEGNPSSAQSSESNKKIAGWIARITETEVESHLAFFAIFVFGLLDNRCVDENDKSVAMGFGLMLIGFAFIPSPIFFGAILDNTCLVWGKTCSGTGNCWLYDGQALR